MNKTFYTRIESSIGFDMDFGAGEQTDDFVITVLDDFTMVIKTQYNIIPAIVNMSLRTPMAVMKIYVDECDGDNIKSKYAVIMNGRFVDSIELKGNDSIIINMQNDFNLIIKDI